ncbi:uncharacterized protein LOC142179875 [Nicotiana tabacum]|uniref:Uncharacterized protein LOC142179875 n=1 Tax=Nicotiana tabacum TaxID=4097 RepID=A0AC58UBK0_TOBAC
MAELWYNTNYQSAIGMTPFKALYGYDPPLPSFELVSQTKLESVDQLLRERQLINKILKDNLTIVQNRMKQCAGRKRSERTFEVGDKVFLKLQPYRQMSVAIGRNLKLAAKFYGPLEIIC